MVKNNKNLRKKSVCNIKYSSVKRLLSIALSAVMLLGVVGVMPDVIVDAAYSYTNAINYAKQYWNNYNSAYKNYNGSGGDCANFVSQCLYAGGVPQDDAWKPYTSAWVSCTAQINYFKSKGYTVKDYAMSSDIKPGNPIYYYNGSSIAHVAICVGYSSSGTPLVAAHNTNHWEHEWTLGGSDYWGGSTRRVTIFINDSTTPEPTPVDVDEKYRVNVSEDSVLYVRSTYNTSGSIVAKLANGTEINITKKVDNWGYIESYDGWVCLDYCVEITPEPAPVNEKYRVKISEDSVLYVRSTYNTSGSIVAKLTNGTEVTISKKVDNWGYSESHGGWLCLDYCEQVSLDTTPPVISDIEIIDITPKGYTVNFKVTDESDIEEVKCSVIAKDSSGNIIGNMKSKDAASSGSGVYSFSVNRSDFNNEKLVFTTSIYAKDIYGNSSSNDGNEIPDVILPEYGDINGDGTINISDVDGLEKYLLNSQTFTKYQFTVADMNNDSKINVFDLIILKRLIINNK